MYASTLAPVRALYLWQTTNPTLGGWTPGVSWRMEPNNMERRSLSTCRLVDFLPQTLGLTEPLVDPGEI